ncbi:hypothetical protein Gotur_027093 [Gossypium turneri]
MELQASLSRIEQMKRTVEGLEMTLQNCEARIEHLEANEDHQSEQLHHLQDQVARRDHIMGEAVVQIQGVAEHLQTLAIQADILSVKYESESYQGQKLASLLREIKIFGARVTPKVIIRKLTIFAYKDNRRVPWNYNCNVTIPGKKDINAVEPKLLVNEPIKEEEAREFLKFLKHSEYSVVEQLHKQPARISVLALLLSSEGHRNALLKVLNETYVADDISVNKLDRLVGNISADNFIFFSDNEIPPGGMRSTRALHITTRCKGYTLPGVLVDNGSALNVLPLSTLNRLSVDSSHMKSCQNVVRAFDGTEKRVMGRIDIPLLIGPTIYEVDFLVMDIKPSYNCLLGRPWIHSAGAVPHRYIKN